MTGRVGDDVDTDTAYDLARRAAIDLLGTARAALGTLDTVAVVKVTGFVQSTPAFTEQSAVINGASDLLVAGLRPGARTACPERDRRRAAAARCCRRARGDLRGRRRTGVGSNR